jgi:probable HAF family extracellular repeat protein
MGPVQGLKSKGDDMKSRLHFTTSLLCLLSLLAVSVGWSAQAKAPRLAHYTVTDLGALPGGSSSYAFDMNDAGWVAGSSTLTPDGLAQHAVLWYGGQVTDLGTLGGPNSAAGGPNSSLEAAVISETSQADPNGEDFCGFGTHLQCLAAVWRPDNHNPLSGVLTALAQLPDGNNTQAYGINNQGQVVGLAENGITDSTCITPSQVRRFEAVIWDRSGNIRQLQPLPGDTVGFGFGINDSGQAVGGSGKCSDTIFPPFPEITAPHAVLWEEDGSPTDLGGLGGASHIASSINNRGDVDGSSQLADGSVHAFLWTRQTGMKDLGTLPDDFLSVAPCCDTVNDRRQVVGFSIGPNGPRAFFWQNGAMTDLNDIASGSTLYLLFAQAINSRGEIVGIGATTTGELHAFLATPILYGSESFSPAESNETIESGRVVLPEKVRTLASAAPSLRLPAVSRHRSTN